MSSTRENAQLLRKMIASGKHMGKETGRTGRLDPGTGALLANPTAGLPDNRVWVRVGATSRTDAGRELRAVWNVGPTAVTTLTADVPVELDRDKDGDWYISGLHTRVANREYPGAAASSLLADPPPEELNHTLITRRNVADFRPQVAEAGGLNLYVKPGRYGGKAFDGAVLDLTSYVTATADKQAVVVVGFDETTGQLVADTGADYDDDDESRPESEIDDTLALATFDDARPIAAIWLANGAAGFLNADIIDLRDLTAVGGPGGGGGAEALDDLTDVDLTTPPTDGQVLVYDGDGSVWIADDAPSGGGGTLAEQDADAVAITGGAIDGVRIGETEQADLDALAIRARDASVASFSQLLAHPPAFDGYRALGTLESPSQVTNGASLMTFYGHGYHSGGDWSDRVAQILLVANEAFTAGAQGTYMRFLTTPIGSTTPADALRIENDGALRVFGGLVNVDGPAVTERALAFRTNTSLRWRVFAGNVPESGGNVGTDFFIWRYSDAGGSLGSALSINRASGAVTIAGALSKGSGTFRIDHPLDPDNKTLYHGFVEAPRYDLIYRGRAELTDGKAVVSIDEASNMTPGTWAALCRNPQVFVQNNDGWTPVRGRVDAGGSLTIEAQDAACTDTIDWLVVAERDDPFIYEDPVTDDDGQLVPEHDKPREQDANPLSLPTRGARIHPDAAARKAVRTTKRG